MIGRNLIAAIGDEDTITGFLLAGIGQGDPQVPDSANTFIVSTTTIPQQVKDCFERYSSRKDIAIIFITQPIADSIRPTVDAYISAFPAVLEIPSKDEPYDPSKDSVLKRVHALLGE